MRWQSGLVGTHVVADALIALAYFCIPLLLWSFVKKRRDFQFNWIFVAFGLFILACGATHVMDVVTLWAPLYRLSAVFKALTAVVSVVTVVALYKSMPLILQLSTPRQLQDQVKEKLQSVVDGATNVAIIATDCDGLITVFNTGAENILGYRSEELIGKQTPRIFHLESEVMKRALELSAELGKPICGMDVLVEKARNGQHEDREWTYVRKDGSHVTVNLVITALYGDSRTITGFLGVAMDVSARKKAEAEKRSSDEHFRLIVEAVEDYAMIMLDSRGLVASWNAGAQRIMGYKAADIIGQHFSCFFLPKDVEERHPEELLGIAAEQGRYSEERERVRKDGSRFLANVVIASVHDETGKLRGFAKVVRDITEIKKTEERFHLAVEASPSGMIMVGASGLMTLVNRQTEKLFGFDRHELLGRPIEMLLPERFRQQHGSHLAGFFVAPLVRPMRAHKDLFGLCKDGTEVPVEISLSPIDTPAGQFVLASVTDISKRKKDGRELREQALILDRANDSIMIRDSQERITYWNQGAERLYGWSREEALGQVTHALFDTRFPEPLKDIEAQLHTNGHWKGELLHRRKDGSLITVASNWTVRSDEANGAASVLEINSDITASKRAEDQVKTALRRQSLAIDALHAGMWDWDLRTNKAVWDERMFEIYGFAPNTEPTYQLWASLVVPEDLPSAEASLQRAIATKSQGSMEFRIRLTNGSLRYIQAGHGTILDDAGQVARLIGINIDTTNRKFNEDLERQVGERTAELRAANKELEEFAHVASHDLKAPLRAIHNTATWLEEDLAEHLTGETREHLTVLQGRVKRMEKLLDDLLEYARIGRATDDRYAETVKGDLLMEDVLALTSRQDFTVAVSPDFANIEVCRMPLQHILMNLIGNAIKHHDKKTGRIAVSVRDDGNFYVFEVTDDGPGIDAQFHARIFDMFRTLKPRDQVEGSGIGLSMVRKHIEVSRGILQLESAVGKGSTFRFTLPTRQQQGREVNESVHSS